jgi:hypothetical protein
MPYYLAYQRTKNIGLLLFSFLLFFLCLTNYQAAFSQNLGGGESFSFLRLPNNAKTAALGGINVSATLKDAGMFVQNPALMHADNHQNLGLNYTAYYAGISHLTANYAHTNTKIGEFGAAIQYLNYGTLKSYDAAGNYLGEFSAQDYALMIAYSKQLKIYRLGVSMKYVGATLAGFNASGLLFDIGGVFVHPKQDWTIGLTVKNIGFGLSNYTTTSTFSMPFDVQLGTSFKPKKMPLRFSLTLHHLYPTDITYNDPNQTQTDIEGKPISNDISFIDKLSRRIVIGSEILFHTNFHARIGYNFLQRRELGISGQNNSQPVGLTGLSFGAMLRVKDFEFNYTYNSLHIAGGLNTIGVTVAMQKVFTKKTTN